MPRRPDCPNVSVLAHGHRWGRRRGALGGGILAAAGRPVAVTVRGRFLFLVPWSGRAIAGTDYRPLAEGPVDVEAFFEAVRRAFS